MAASGARWWGKKQEVQRESIVFCERLLEAPINKIALENPVGILSTAIRKPDQIIHPWMFGHETTKATCLWLKNLPPLVPTNIVSKGERQVYASGRSLPLWMAKTGKGTGHARSLTYQGIADAMAEQWG